MQNKLRQHINEIIPLTDTKFDSILSHFIYKKAKKREVLIEEGKMVEHIYFVASGLGKLTFSNVQGKVYIVSFAMENWWESDFSAFFGESKATMSLICLEDSDVYCISLKNYRELCNDIPIMEHFSLVKANLGSIGAQQRIINFLTGNTKERYEHLIKNYPQLLQRVPKKNGLHLILVFPGKP